MLPDVGDSDADLLVEYEPAADWSLLDTARLRAELAELFGRPVDLVRERDVTNRYRLASIRRDRASLVDMLGFAREVVAFIRERKREDLDSDRAFLRSLKRSLELIAALPPPR